jgi:hypothetical protein
MTGAHRHLPSAGITTMRGFYHGEDSESCARGASGPGKTPHPSSYVGHPLPWRGLGIQLSLSDIGHALPPGSLCDNRVAALFCRGALQGGIIKSKICPPKGGLYKCPG